MDDIRNDLTRIADMIGSNSTAAITFKDSRAAEEILNAMQADQRIVGACVYGKDDIVLACYPTGRRSDLFFPERIPGAGERYYDGDLELFRAIRLSGEEIGRIGIRFDMGTVRERWRRYGEIVGLTTAVCFLIALLVSWKLQQVLSGPVLDLARTAKEISSAKNYSVRAVKQGEDEIGILTDAFNEMLTRISEHAGELRAVTDSAKDAIVSVDTGGTIVSWNKGAESMFGCGEGEAAGKSILQYLSMEDGVNDDQQLVALGIGHNECSGKIVEVRGVRIGGGEFPVELTTSSWTTKRGTFYTSLIRDVSERKLLETQLAQAQKLESIGQLATGIAHEINTPIQYVSDNIRFLDTSFQDITKVLDAYERLVRRTDPAGVLSEGRGVLEVVAEESDLTYLRREIPRAIEESEEGVERVASIVRAMKEFSHPGPLEMKAIDINHAIESTLTVSRNEWKYVAEAVRNFDSTLPAVRCLPSEFNQVILNLIVNAAHAIAELPEHGNGEAKGRITVSTRRDGRWAEIRVSDTGIGIPEALRPRIFTPFFTTKDVGKGTGQGLSIAHSVIVKRHGGTIAFETEERKGTTFVVRLPIDGIPANGEEDANTFR